MPMALHRIVLHAHERGWMLQIEEPVQVPLEIRGDDTAIVPAPYRVSRPCFDSLRSHGSRNAPLPYVVVAHTSRFDSTLKIRLAELRFVHADRIVPNIEK